jgi:hypothetical protein
VDNKVFNVNGKSKELLAKVLDIKFSQDGYAETKAKAWAVHPEKGLILYWHKDTNTNALLTPLSASGVVDMVWEWLKSDEAKTIKMVDTWEVNMKHDGSNSLGWRVYVEDWGHVADSFYAICAIKPAYLWHGK